MALGRDRYGNPTIRYDSTIDEYEVVKRHHTHHSDRGDGNTHATVFRLPNPDMVDRDPLVESNFRVALKSLNTVEENHPSGIDDDIAQDVWVTREIGTGDKVIVVRVRGVDGTHTPVFRAAYRLCMKLVNGCSYLDENDFGECQDAMFMDEVTDVVTSIVEGSSDFGGLLESPQQARIISMMVMGRCDEIPPDGDYGHVSEDAVMALWSECRDLYYQGLADQALADWAEMRRAALAPVPE